MAISADMVKKLRDQTGVGMMDCKKALTETNGDYEKATTLLREKGIAVAAKRESRMASEGVIGTYISDDSQTGVLVELNCETTFVAKTDEFITLAGNIAKHIAHTSPSIISTANVDELIAQPFFEDPSQAIKDVVNTLVAKLGEKTTVTRFVRIDVGGPDHESNGAIGSYIHMGNQIGVMVEMNCESEEIAASEGISQLAKDLAMHISWSTPEFMEVCEIPADVIEKERDVHRQWAIKEGKPEQIIEKIVDGRMKEYYSRACLVEQAFIKDDSMTISDLIKTFMRDAGETVNIAGFARFRVGETAGGTE